MFELNNQFTDGVYDGVVSSENYPHTTTSPLAFGFAVTGMPLDVFVTYSIISPDTEFEGSQHVEVSVGNKSLRFDSSASRPTSLKQSGDRMLIQSISATCNNQHSVIILRYQGMSAICEIIRFCISLCVVRFLFDLKNVVSEIPSSQ